MRKPFLVRLVDGKDASADSLVFGALVAIFSVTALSAYDVIGQHHEFYPMSFGGGVAAILGGLGGGKMVRDRWSSPGYQPLPIDQREPPYFEVPRQRFQPGEHSVDLSIDNPDARRAR